MSNLKNVEAFGKLVGICTGYGGSYNPGKPNLRMESLTELLANSREAVRQVSTAKTELENATNKREVAYINLKKLVSRIVFELRSSQVLPQTLADAYVAVRKIRGQVLKDRAPVASTANEVAVEVTRKRTYGSDYSSVVYHFQKLIQTLAAEPRYQPGITDLQVPSLQTTLSELRAINAAVLNAVVAWGKARRDRNELLYTNENSLIAIARAVRQQVRATFGHNSEATRATYQIRFTKPNVR
ncbi:MAG: hypothetical protein JNM78_06095 [Cyclobacteriaceae bacterium]|nr:hypothetical protein [Cyclobacteriaceae bacterium]